MKRSWIARWIVPALLVAAAGNALAYESMYPPTPPGTIEVKTLPAVRVLEATAGKPGVERQDGAFMTLFRYIDANALKMTVPVEADPQPARMRFFVERRRTDELPSTAGVTVFDRPARVVASVGIRGSYSEQNFAEGVAQLRAWLRERPQWRAKGEPYAVYWNGPYVPGFLKKSEVHVEVEAVS